MVVLLMAAALLPAVPANARPGRPGGAAGLTSGPAVKPPPSFTAERAAHDRQVAAARAKARAGKAVSLPPTRAVAAEPANPAYDAPAMPQRLQPGVEDQVEVTVTNVTAADLPAGRWALSYHWKTREGRDVTSPANQRFTKLPKDLAAGAKETLTAKVVSPDPLFGNSREEFVISWDLYDTSTRKWLSQQGVPPLAQDVTVEDPTSDQLGLEKFYQYSGTNTGAGSNLMVNQFSGNAVWGYNPFSHPSRGPRTFLRLAYNTLDTSDVYAGPGWTISASSVQRLGTPLQFGGWPGHLGYPATVTLTDGDGTSHVYKLNKNDSHDPKKWTYDSPAGVHLYLQRNASKGERAWVMTRPDRTRFYFDDEGYQTSVVDRNDNALTFTYERARIGGRNTGMLKHLTDATGRRTLTIDYYQRGDAFWHMVDGKAKLGSDLSWPGIINKVKSITDLSGRRLDFVYDEQGLLGEVVDGAQDVKTAKVFGFHYDRKALENPKLTAVTDPNGHGTALTYADQHPRRWVQQLTDRRGKATGFAYSDPDGPKGTKVQSKVTDANGHTSTYLIDGFGRPEKVTNAKNETRTVIWDDDNNVVRMQEANGAVATWKYDKKTGHPLESRDPEANKNGTPPTRLTYRTDLDGHVGEIATKTSPEGNTWTFAHDPKGNLTSVTDPKGNATKYAYDEYGQLTEAVDPNGHTTAYRDYDPVGYPRTTVDALGNTATLAYDVLGAVVSSTDARKRTSTYTYDGFGRPLSSKVPKDQDAGVFIFTPGPVYDRNDNVVKNILANGAQARTSVNESDQPVAVRQPKDTDDGGERLTTLSYDNAGNLIRQTEPRGNLTDDPDDFTTTTTYDVLNRAIRVTDPLGAALTNEYDNVGNLVKSVDRRKNATADPNDFTVRAEYDLNHRPVKSVDAAGKTVGQTYDLDGHVVAMTDQDGNRTLFDVDERGLLASVAVPYRKDGDETVRRTTRFEYDKAGNRTKVVYPNGRFQETVYDALDRVHEELTPFDPDDPRYGKPDKTIYTYNEVGHLTKVSAPPSSGESVRNDTGYTYYDNGWIRTSSDPWNIVNGYDYNDLGQQTKNTLTSAGGSVSRTMDWEFFPSGNLARRSDQGTPVGRDEVLVDNSDPIDTASNAAWNRTRSLRGAQGPDAATRPAGDGDAKFTWRPQIPRTGTYEVFVRYPKTGGAARNATYTITHSAGTATRTVDQSRGAGEWVSLGRHPFTEGRGPAITLTDKASGKVSADAVKLVRDNSGDLDDERKQFDYRYDVNGNLTQVDDRSPGARIDGYLLQYDQRNRIGELKELAAGAVKNTTSFTYDENGSPTSRKHDDVWSAYEYDERDLLSKVTNAKSPDDPDKHVTQYGYTSRREIAQETKPNGNVVDYAYYLNGLIRTQAERKKDNGPVVAEHALEYTPNGDPAKDVSRLMNADDPGKTVDNTYTFTYDPRDRISKLVKTGDKPDTETYVHDANSNVIEQTVDGKTTKHDYDRNRLVSSTTGGVATTHRYDPLGRLDTTSTAGETVSNFNYDGFDRIAEHIGGAGAGKKTVFTYDPWDRTATETGPSGDKEKKKAFNYLGLTGSVLSEEDDGKLATSYLPSPGGQKLTQIKHKDEGGKEISHYTYHPKGDVEALTKEDGNTRATYGYTAYGKNDASKFTGVDKASADRPEVEPYNAYRFNAHRFDSATGTYDMGFRNYDPGLNRFLTRDMYMGALSDMALTTDPFTGSRYAFAGGNPISNVELDGHGFGSFLRDLGHATLDVVGLIPVVGEVADGVNAAWYGVECAVGVDGACLDAALSAAAMVPGLGWGATGAKWAKRGADAVSAASDAGKRVDPPSVPKSDPGPGTPPKTDPGPGTPPKTDPGPGAPPPKTDPAPAPKPKPEPDPPAATCKVPNSFVPGTRVRMADGSLKPIEQVRKGDRVAATDPETGAARSRAVGGTMSGWGRKALVQVTVDPDGKDGGRTGTVVATAGHRFWLPERGTWAAAALLTPGTWLRTSDGNWARVTAVKAYTSLTGAYNLSIKGNPTYYVVAGGTGLLVHNCGEVPLNSGGLPEMAHAYRMGANPSGKALSSYQNVAVFKVDKGDGTFDHIIEANIREGLHSEQIIDNFLRKHEIDPGSVKEIYSERIPCSKKENRCMNLVKRYTEAGAKLTWSLSGSTRSNAAALRRAMNESRGF
ncbi:nucleic acid/nucleotide deaminase domain-containing protein [Actinomadura sp. 9N215]|uniref:golvesin C-terminal-like domain-containing protein n=1 Tax=Actinomadura sp. 9N215 TaxID=3375150 RepID=UPI00378B5E7F